VVQFNLRGSCSTAAGVPGKPAFGLLGWRRPRLCGPKSHRRGRLSYMGIAKLHHYPEVRKILESV
jgi:hypothetical protein